MIEDSISIVDDELLVEYSSLQPESTEKKLAGETIRNIIKSSVELTPDFLKSLCPDNVYKISWIPEGSSIFTDKAGNLTGTCTKNGKFAGHVRLEKIGPQISQLIKGISQQVVLAYIVSELKEIKAGVQQIHLGMHDDRVAKVIAALKLVSRAVDLDSYRQCIPRLQEGIIQLEKEMQSDLCSIPTLRAGFFDNWLGASKTDELSRFYNKFSEAFSTVISGYEGLIECYAKMPNCIEACMEVVNDLKSFMERVDYQLIRDLCRHLPRHTVPENTWKQLAISEERNKYFIKLAEIASLQPKECCITISGADLKELCDGM